MKEVWIFGDSYADPKYFGNEYSWPKCIEKLHNVKNFAHAGSGPDYQLSLFLSQFNAAKTDLKTVSVIFYISAVHRINFKFIRPFMQAAPYRIISKGDNRFFDEISKSNKTFIDKFFKEYIFHSTFMDTETDKLVCLLKEYSNLFEKMLVFPVFDQPTMHISNTRTFQLVGQLLYEVERIPDPINETRDNHLSPPNHLVMTEQLLNWINNETPIDFSKFEHKN